MEPPFTSVVLPPCGKRLTSLYASRLKNAKASMSVFKERQEALSSGTSEALENKKRVDIGVVQL
jgi:hypothetical protein